MHRKNETHLWFCWLFFFSSSISLTLEGFVKSLDPWIVTIYWWPSVSFLFPSPRFVLFSLKCRPCDTKHVEASYSMDYRLPIMSVPKVQTYLPIVCFEYQTKMRTKKMEGAALVSGMETRTRQRPISIDICCWKTDYWCSYLRLSGDGNACDYVQKSLCRCLHLAVRTQPHGLYDNASPFARIHSMTPVSSFSLLSLPSICCIPKPVASAAESKLAILGSSLSEVRPFWITRRATHQSPLRRIDLCEVQTFPLETSVCVYPSKCIHRECIPIEMHFVVVYETRTWTPT